MEVSHPAASQLITNLKNKNLVASATCADDGRRQLVQLTPEGRQLLKQILPVWEAIQLSMAALVTDEPACNELLSAISALENSFKMQPLADRITNQLNPAIHE